MLKIGKTKNFFFENLCACEYNKEMEIRERRERE
jgi:hypothetical protein